MDKCNTYDNRMVGWVISAVTTKSTIVYCSENLSNQDVKVFQYSKHDHKCTVKGRDAEMSFWIIYLCIFGLYDFCYFRGKQYPNLSIPVSKTLFPSLIFRHLIPTKSRRLTVMFIISGLFREEKIAYFYMVLLSMKNQVKEHWSFGFHYWKIMPA